MFNLSKVALHTKGNEAKAKYLAVFNDTIYFLNEKNTPFLKKLCKELGLETNDYNFYSLISELKASEQNIIIGEYDPINKTLEIDGTYEETHSPASHLLKNVTKQLNIRKIKYTEGNSGETISQYYQSEVTGQIPDVLYHGTSSASAVGICRFGLMPNEKTNYSINHQDKVFLTSQFSKAAYHAINATLGKVVPFSTRKPSGFLVIFEFKIPDKNLLVPDYDVENLVTEEKRTDNYRNLPSLKNYSPPINSDPFSLSKSYGIFGYKGRIPANFITRIFIREYENETISTPNSWTQVNQSQLFSAIEHGVENYDIENYCLECGMLKESCSCDRCEKCGLDRDECTCLSSQQKVTSWSFDLKKSKPLIKTANTSLINNQKRFEIEISDTDRYTSDKYEIVLALTHTIRGHSLGLQINSAQLGVANYVEYWHYDDNQENLADKTFGQIKTKLLEVSKHIQFNCPPLATILPMFRYALRDIDIDHKEKSGVQLYNEYLRLQDKVEDYRTSLYGDRFNTFELSYLGENWINSDDVSKQIEINEKGRKKQFYYKQASNSSFYKDAEVLAMNDKFASWINLSKNLVLPFLTWLSLTYGIQPAEAQQMATSQPVQIQQKVEEFKQQETKQTAEPPKSQFSDKFKKCLNTTLKFEGGYSNHPSDKGKATNFGITTQTYKNYLANNKINKPADVKSISRKEVEKIYYDMYWIAIQGERLPEPIALVMFDYAVHSGPSKAIKGLQKTLSLKETGRIDNNTIDLLTKIDPSQLAQNLLKERQAFLTKLVQKQKTNKAFAKGWNNRCNSIQKQIVPTKPTIKQKKKMPIVPNSLKQRCENIPEKWNYDFSQQAQLFI